MFKIRYAENDDKEYWYTLDRHLPDKEFEKKFVTKWHTLFWKMKNQSEFYDTIYFGITLHF